MNDPRKPPTYKDRQKQMEKKKLKSEITGRQKIKWQK